MKLVIGTVGNTKRWKNVMYSLSNKNGERVKIESSFSAHAISEAVNPDKTILVGLDTLANINDEKIINYESVVDEVKNGILTSAEKHGWNGFDIIVGPGVGEFETGIFEGDPLDFYFITYLRIFDIIKDEKNIDIHLDVTHGINFATLMTYKIMDNILSAISMKGGAVKLTVYNSEPVILSNDMPDTGHPVNIHRIEKRFAKPNFNIGRVGGQIMRHLGDAEFNAPALRIKFVNQISWTIENMLLFTYSYIKHKYCFDLYSTAKEYENRYIDGIHVSNGRIKKDSVFTREIYPFLRIMSYASVIDGFGVEYPVDLVNMKDLTCDLEKYSMAAGLIKHEISDILKIFKFVVEERWTLLGKIKMKDEGNGNHKKQTFDESRICSEINKRNFVAHGGFEMNNTEVSVKHGRVYARYAKRCEQTVDKLINGVK